jgi:DNA-binding NarL/FixJ family response regulator
VPAAESPLRVLLVDDDAAFTELVTHVLQTGGIEVVAHGHDGLEGVELARELRPDAVVMDIRMPRMDGFEATGRILNELPDVAVVVVSSSTDPADVERALDAGAAGYLSKDRAAAELLERLEQLRPLPVRRPPPPRRSYRLCLVS